MFLVVCASTGADVLKPQIDKHLSGGVEPAGGDVKARSRRAG